MTLNATTTPNQFTMSWDNFIASTLNHTQIQHYVRVAKDFMNFVTEYTVDYDATHNYQISKLAKNLHKVPRFDVDLKQVNNTFDPYSSHYLESLGIWVAIPGFWLVLTLLLFLIFFICRCCAITNRNSKGEDDSLDGSLSQEGKKRSSATSNCCSRFFLFILAILTIGSIGVGLYGCLQMQVGMYQVQSALHNISHTVGVCRNHTSFIQSSMNSIMKDSLAQLGEASNRPNMARHSQNFAEFLRSAGDSQRLIQYKIDDVEHELYTVGLDNTERTLSMIEDYRRPMSIVVIAVLMFINMVLIYGVCCNSRCFLLMYGVFGLVAIIICWLSCSLYLGLTIATADFCENPQPFFVESQNRAPQEIFEHYLYCQAVPEAPLFQKGSQRPLSAIRDLDDLFTSFADKTNKLHQYCSRERCGVGQTIAPISEIISKSLMSLSNVRNQLRCNPLHNYYTSGMTGLCKTAFEGALLTLLVMTFGGLLFTLLVLSSSQLWISIKKRRAVPVKADVFADNEVDPFLPSSNASTSSRRNNLSMAHYGVMPTGSRPSAPSMIQTRNRVNEENLAFLSPPPAYDHLQQQQLNHHHQMTYGNTGHHPYPGQPYSSELFRSTLATKF